MAEEVWARALDAGLPPRQQGRGKAKRTPYPDVGAWKLPLAPPSELFISGLAAKPRKSRLELDGARGRMGW